MSRQSWRIFENESPIHVLPVLNLREHLWLHEMRGWHYTVDYINFFLFLNWSDSYYNEFRHVDCKSWKCFHLTKTYWTFKGLTWAAACSSSLTVKPFALWPRSVLTMWCSTTWFGGSVTGFSVLCQKKKKKMVKETKETIRKIEIQLWKIRQKLASRTSLIILCL